MKINIKKWKLIPVFLFEVGIIFNYIKRLRFYIACLFMIGISYPVSAVAAVVVKQSDLTAPFLFSWLGVWVFSMAGGICSGFVRIDDIDSKLYFAIFAKIFIGTFSGVALCLLIVGNEEPEAALTFWAFFASLFSSPLVAGGLVYISNQRRLDQIFNRVGRHAQDRYLPISTEYKKPQGVEDANNTDTDLL